MRQAVHFEGIARLQNYDYVQRFIDSSKDMLSQYLPSGLADIKAYLLLGRETMGRNNQLFLFNRASAILAKKIWTMYSEAIIARPIVAGQGGS